MDDLEALDLATSEVQRRVDLVSGADLCSPNPCDEWDVRYLIAHLVGGNRFASLVLQGASADDALQTIMTTTHIGPEPARDFADSALDQRRCFRLDGALDRDVEHPIGVLPVRRFLRFRVFDCAVHAWDLATALGVDARLDPSLVDAVLGIIGSEQPGMGFGIDAVVLDPAHDPSPLDELLALSGRTPASSGRA